MPPVRTSKDVRWKPACGAPHHFLCFLPVPHGHRSFLPIFGAALMIWEAATPALISFLTRLPLGYLRHSGCSPESRHPISATVSSTRRRWGLPASRVRTRCLPVAVLHSSRLGGGLAPKQEALFPELLELDTGVG